MIEEIGEGIFQISTTSQPGFGCSLVFLVAGRGRLALIESSAAARHQEVLAGIREAGYNPEDLDYIIPTHIHIDHAGGLGMLAKQFVRPLIALPEAGARHMIDPTRLNESTRRVFGPGFEEGFGRITPVPENRAWVVKGGETVDLGGRELHLYAAPGHAPHHMVLQDSSTGLVFAGEGSGGYFREVDLYVPWIVPPAFDPPATIQTYHMLREMHPAGLICSHSGMLPDMDRALREAEELTLRYGELARAALREGSGEAGLSRRLAGYLRARLAAGPKGQARAGGWEKSILATLVDMAASAYITYFKRSGVV